MFIQFLVRFVFLATASFADAGREKNVQICHFELRKLNVTPALASRACIQKNPIRLLEMTQKLRSKGLAPDLSAEEAIRISNQSVFE